MTAVTEKNALLRYALGMASLFKRADQLRGCSRGKAWAVPYALIAFPALGLAVFTGIVALEVLA
jgi:hypothetical protein